MSMHEETEASDVERDDYLTEFEPHIRRLVDAAPAPGRNCARSALRHLDKAQQLRAIDAEMEFFRLITAEEEAAAAVFHALRRRRYPHSDRLNPTSHVHKLALWPFTLAVRLLFLKIKLNIGPELITDNRGEHFRTKLPGDLLGRGFIDPPLDATIYENDAVYDFRDGLSLVASHSGVESILQRVRRDVKTRNKLLYGDTQGIWVIDETDDFSRARRSCILGHLLLFLMIDPFPKHQVFVLQCLPVFLRVLELLPTDENIGNRERAP